MRIVPKRIFADYRQTLLLPSQLPRRKRRAPRSATNVIRLSLVRRCRRHGCRWESVHELRPGLLSAWHQLHTRRDRRRRMSDFASVRGRIVSGRLLLPQKCQSDRLCLLRLHWELRRMCQWLYSHRHRATLQIKCLLYNGQ